MSWEQGAVGPANYDTLATFTTARYIQDNLEDQISARNTMAKFFAVNDTNARFRERMGMRPRRRPFHEGQQIEVPLRYALGDIQWIYGSSPLNTARHEYASIGKYEWKEAVSPPMTCDRRMKNINSGNVTKLMDLVRMDAEQSMISMIEGLETDMGGSATGFKVLGIQDLIEDSPTSTVGGINRTTYSWWQNYADTTAIDNFGTGHAGYEAMETAWSNTERGVEKCDVIFTTNAVQRYFKQYLVENSDWNLWENDEMAADIGRGVPFFHGAPVIQSSGIAAKHMYFCNTDMIFLVMMGGQDFVETGVVRAVNTLSQVNFIYAMLAFIITNPQRNGVITDIQAF